MTSAEHQAFYIGAALAKLAAEHPSHDEHFNYVPNEKAIRAVEAVEDELSRTVGSRNFRTKSLAASLAGRMDLDPSSVARYEFVAPSVGNAHAIGLADSIITDRKVAPSVLAHELGHLKSQRSLGGRAIQAARSLGDPIDDIAPGIGAGALGALAGLKGGKAGMITGLLAGAAAVPTFLRRKEEERAWEEADKALDSLQEDNIFYGEDERDAARTTKERALATYDTLNKTDAIGLAAAPAAYFAGSKLRGKGKLAIPATLLAGYFAAPKVIDAAKNIVKSEGTRDSLREDLDKDMFLSRVPL